MIKDGIGGVNTKTGLEFELQTDLKEIISKLKNYEVRNYDFNTSRKNGKVIKGKKLRSIEKKTQSGSGSVDEKLQTCDFKLKQYRKLFSPLNKEVKYYYLLEKEWFSQQKYKDVLDYIISVGCGYYFNYIPLSALGLPVEETCIDEV